MAVVAAVACASAPAASAEPPIAADAAGNAFFPAPAFVPANLTVKVGQAVVWTNTDMFAPHTATESHGLWDLTGTYFESPANPAGFAPGETRARRFEAGAISYYCRVHPEQMKGVISVPVSLFMQSRVVRRRVRFGKRFRTVRSTQRHVAAIWSPVPVAEGQVFDVEVARGTGAYTPLATGATKRSARITAGRSGTVTRVRARLRSASTPTAATDWSPEASITTP